MYTSYIGKKFLKFYNEYEGFNLSAEEFCLKVQFPLFFDSEKYLMQVHNSTFHQSIGVEKISESKSEYAGRVKRLQDDILNRKISASIYVGYAAGDVAAVTSGQVTTIEHNITTEEIYQSWIGQGLAVGLKGGLIFLDDEKIFKLLFSGWKLYRKLLNQTPNLKPRQIETWNGQWLSYCSRFTTFESIKEDQFQVEIDSSEKEGGYVAIATVPWVKIVFALCKMFGNRTFTANAFVSSKANSTYGFVNIFLKDIRKLYELKDQLFANTDSILTEEELENVSTFYNFNGACKLGTIGLRAVEPAKIREYMPKGTFEFTQGKNFKFLDENSFIQYNLYKIWIIAMINKTELLTLAGEIANALIESEKLDERGKKVFSLLSEEIRESTNLRVFIEKITNLIDKDARNAITFKKVVEHSLKMPSDLFPLFVTLIRFEYAYIKSNISLKINP